MNRPGNRHLLLPDAALPQDGGGGVAVGDVDGDGKPEVAVGARFYYKPGTAEHHLIPEVSGHVGTALGAATEPRGHTT